MIRTSPYSVQENLSVFAFADAPAADRYNSRMPDARKILDQQFLEMRWRCLSLAADFDRIERATGGPGVIASDPRLADLRVAMRRIAELSGNVSRAEFVQTTFSDKSPGPGNRSL